MWGLLGGCQDIPSPPPRSGFSWIFQVSFTKLWTSVSFLLFAQIFLWLVFQNTVNVFTVKMQIYLHRELKNTELCSLSEPPLMKQLKQGFITVPGQSGQSWSAFLTVRHFLFFFFFFHYYEQYSDKSPAMYFLIFQPRSFSFKERSQSWLAGKHEAFAGMICNLQIYRLTNLHHKLND